MTEFTQNTEEGLTTKFSEAEDDISWVLHHLHSLGLKCTEEDISGNMLEALHTLFTEKNHWQSQSQCLSEMTTELKGRVSSLEKEREIHKSEIVMLKQDLNVSEEKMNGLRSEHREVKCQWLNEKSELESRIHQTLALNTQIQGTLRKKERDYDRLQTQLSKLTSRTSSKGGAMAPKGKNDSGSGQTILLSKPLKRNSSQKGDPAAGSLEMAEVSAAKATIASLEIENQNLRIAVEDLTQNFEEFQANMTNSNIRGTQNESDSSIISTPQDSIQGDAAESFEDMSCLEQAKYVERQLDAVNKNLASATQSTPSAKFSTPNAKKLESVPGSVSSARKQWLGNSITGTPKARPINWIVKQANSEVKALRERAEKLKLNMPPSDANSSALTPSKYPLDIDDKENETPRKAQLHKNEKALRSALYDYRQQLEEACAVICEQDRLIHAALMGKNAPASKSWEYKEEDDEDEVGGDDFDDLNGPGSLTPGSKLRIGTTYDESDWTVENFLPTVSPDTMDVLTESQFQILPPVALSMEDEGPNPMSE